MVLNLKYRRLKAFQLAVATGSFTAAAQQLAITQPSFTALIRELEDDVGVRLFDRTTRRCTPTAAAMAFHDEVAHALDQLEAGYQHLREIGAGHRGWLSVAALPSLASGLVSERLAAYRRLRPGVRVTLREYRHQEILDAVRRGEVELGVGGHLRQESDLHFIPLFSDRIVYVVPVGHELVHRPPTWRQAERFDLILMSTGAVEHAMRANQVRAQPILEVHHAATALSLVRHGLGITILPSTSLDRQSMQGLAAVAIEGTHAVRQLGILHRRHVALSRAAQGFIAELRRPRVPEPAA